MRALLALTAAIVLAAAVAPAQETAPQAPAETTLHGYIVDAMCAKGMMKHPETAMKRAARHTRECALEEECARSGFGVLADGKWYAFDDAGNKLALKLLRSTAKEKGISVEATGTLHEDRLAVTMLTEAKPLKVKAKTH
jgi:hypothetical protein